MKQPYDGLLFDMDGVLVDVSQSYRLVIKKTAEFFTSKEIIKPILHTSYFPKKKSAVMTLKNSQETE